VTWSWGASLPFFFGVIGAAVAACRPGAGREPLKVAAAADLTFAFQDLGAEFEKRTGEPVKFSFGATGLLEKQIVEGAPFDLFAAGDVAFVDDAIHSGACLADSKALYAAGRLALVQGPAAAGANAVGDLADPRLAKIAIANPEHAPYGKAAKQALERSGVWDRVRPRLVYGENVRQALEFVESGNADAAIVALSLVKGRAAAVSLPYLEVPRTLHDPIVQALVVCSHGKAGAPAAAAQQFAAFVQSSDGRALLARYGFESPDAR
jgi:molybdate transport system substrate-binding protein